MSSDTYPPNDGQTAQETAGEAKQPERASEQGEPAGGEALKAEIAELNDRILRLAAELENTRRRGEREKADASRYAIAGFAREQDIDTVPVTLQLQRIPFHPDRRAAADPGAIILQVTGRVDQPPDHLAFATPGGRLLA